MSTKIKITKSLLSDGPSAAEQARAMEERVRQFRAEEAVRDAAPELLETLLAVVSELDSGCQMRSSAEKKVRAAIAKAKGRPTS